MNESEKPLWQPSQDQIEKTEMGRFLALINQKYSQDLKNFQELLSWSIENMEDFWSESWDYFDIIGEKGERILINSESMMDSEFFPDAKLNYAENLLRRRDDHPALIFREETGEERVVTFKDLYDRTSKLQQALKDMGVKKGDRVAAYMPNIPETIIACLAATSLGAIFSSASPDFGTQGLLDRFGQIEPKVLISADGYYYNGKSFSSLDKVRDVQPQIKSLEKIIVVPFTDQKPDLSGLENAVTLGDFTKAYSPADIAFERVEFDHPLFIMFSSGTTGVPKCIVHGHGGTLIQNFKEIRLHCDIAPLDKIFYFTTCGWMMWNWLITGLACEATLLLFDGSPFYPDGHMLWEFTSKHDCKLFGTSAKYIDALKANDIHPGDHHDLSSLKIMTSTGSPLVHTGFDFVYAHIKKDIHLASIYGGTDIISASFGLGNPISPVWRGELQGPGLGMDVRIFNDQGQEIPPGGGAGELVCTKPFPSMPVMFWNDPENKKYSKAYFETYPNIWHHGDWVEKTVHNGFIVHGRSDATLNPGGVRIGTAEIYRQVEKIPEIIESIAVGQDWDGDVRIILFVILKEGVQLDDALIKKVKTQIRDGASPRHMPAKIVPVTDIPKTKSGKMTELAVRDVIHGRQVKNVEALANPEALALYKDLDVLKAS